MNNILYRTTPRGTPGRRKLRKLDPGAVERAKRKEAREALQAIAVEAEQIEARARETAAQR